MQLESYRPTVAENGEISHGTHARRAQCGTSERSRSQYGIEAKERSVSGGRPPSAPTRAGKDGGGG